MCGRWCGLNRGFGEWVGGLKKFIPTTQPQNLYFLYGLYKFRYVPDLFDPENLTNLKIQFQQLQQQLHLLMQVE